MWDQSRIQQYIDDEIEESLGLDYKAAGALGRSDSKKKEITKDVSAMANSSGGIIIYGVKEHDENEKRHLPEKIDPVNQSEFSKEWLEHIVNNIHPKINGIAIYPVRINSAEDEVVYVVEIPESITAHQASDKRYYRRYNFESAPMDDYEIRMVMNRERYPTLEISRLSCKYKNETKRVNMVSNKVDEVKIINAEFDLVIENTSLVRAENVRGGIIGWSDGDGLGVSETYKQNFNIVAPELNVSFDRPMLTLKRKSLKIKNYETIDIFEESPRINVQGFALPYKIGTHFYNSEWNAIAYLTSKDSHLTMYRIHISLNQEFLKTTLGDFPIEANNSDFLRIEKLSTQVPTISYSSVEVEQ